MDQKTIEERLGIIETNIDWICEKLGRNGGGLCSRVDILEKALAQGQGAINFTRLAVQLITFLLGSGILYAFMKLGGGQ